jgi:hypothetical protein
MFLNWIGSLLGFFPEADARGERMRFIEPQKGAASKKRKRTRKRFLAELSVAVPTGVLIGASTGGHMWGVSAIVGGALAVALVIFFDPDRIGAFV